MLHLQGPLTPGDKKRSPGSQRSPSSTSQQERSPGSMSQRSPSSGLSRHGTMRSSHKRKNSISTPLNLTQGRRSPSLFQDQKSPQGHKSPILLIHEPTLDNPNYMGYDRRSPTTNQSRQSPSGFYQGFDPDRNRSPTSNYDQDRRSPSGLGSFESGRRSPTNNGRRSPTSNGRRSPSGYQGERRMSTVQVQSRLSPIGFPLQGISSITISPTGNRSPIDLTNIPPITVSNPSETYAMVSKAMEFSSDGGKETSSSSKDSTLHKDVSPIRDNNKEPKKEKPSVMREILAFVRKPSKKVVSTTPTSSSSNTRSGRFAAAFSRAESGAGTPLLRQSTFSTSPAASSRAAKSAVTKQMSEVGYEPKISLKFTKMSLRLRRSGDPSEKKSKDKKSSGDEISESENDSSVSRSDYKLSGSGPSSRSASIVPFELENVHFEKVGDSYIKHDSIITEESIDSTSPIKIVATSDDKNAQINLNPQFSVDTCANLIELKNTLVHIINDDSNNTDSNEQMETVIEQEVMDGKSGKEGLAKIETQTIKMTVQCPTVEIEPPSRRASFDPPRSPYLESLRSPNETANTDHSSKFDSGGDSFELIDTDRNRESSFEDRYPSSRDTSFDISRYQSTSYEDQNSSFELVEVELHSQPKNLNEEQCQRIDLRKSSIELVDVETFQRPGPGEGRKSSLETHFDYTRPTKLKKPELTTSKSSFGLPRTKKQISEPSRCREPSVSNMKSHYSAPHRARSPLSQQTSSNFSSRDSYDSSFEPIFAPPLRPPELTSPFADPTKKHFPMPRKSSNDNQSTSFLCTDQRCASIFEPRPSNRNPSPFLSDSGNEFEPPSPRRAASASPKHTFTFRIVLKKVDSSPDAICPSAERRGRIGRRRDSRKKKLKSAGKSF